MRVTTQVHETVIEVVVDSNPITIRVQDYGQHVAILTQSGNPRSWIDEQGRLYVVGPQGGIKCP